MYQNRLGEETSPYLLQHKENPVHWQAWDADALAAAKTEDKPILLSIGYAACHWCHVMAHESFENPQIAAAMNDKFINIKVDREERPDLDAIYQNALALMGEQGGWPLTMFLTPEGEPFWGGTYYPPEPRWGRPGFPQVLDAISAAYRQDRDNVMKNVVALRDALKRLEQPQRGDGVAPELFDSIAERLLREVDPLNGGIGHAPKFPQCGIFELLWRGWKRTRRDPYREAVTRTLTTILRPSGRRLCALCHRRPLAGAAFREDAVRQRRIDEPADPGLAGDPRSALRAARRRDNRLARTRDDPPRGRLLQQPRCRQRGRGGEILRLVRGRDRCGARRACRSVQAVLRRHRRGQLGGAQYSGPTAVSRSRRRQNRSRAGALPRVAAEGARAAGAARAR